MILLNTTYGDIKIQLFTDKAPETCANFVRYVTEKFYDNTLFHRVIDGFMIQGGGFDHDFNQKTTGAPINNEASNGLSNVKGTIAMARTADPHSATSQFFINVADNVFLDYQSPTAQSYGYCVFGKVVEGLDVIEKIQHTPTGRRQGHQDVPLEDICLNSVSFIESPADCESPVL